MRKKNSIINMIVGLVGQLLNMLLSFGGRMVFVHYLSQEYLGVNGLFGDVLGMLNLAELGIGSAMIFSMYRPAAQNDEKQLARLMNLYRTLYRIVALAVLGIGLALMPFLPLLMKGGEGVENLPFGNEAGGLSGAPVRDKSTHTVRVLAGELKGRLPIIAVGGITEGAHAAEKIAAGASLVQIYSGFIYKGPALIREAVDAIAALPRS